MWQLRDKQGLLGYERREAYTTIYEEPRYRAKLFQKRKCDRERRMDITRQPPLLETRVAKPV